MTHYRRALLQQELAPLRWYARAAIWVAVFVAFAWDGLKSIWSEL